MNGVQIQFQHKHVCVYILGEKSLSEWQRFVHRANFQFASNVQLFKLADVFTLDCISNHFATPNWISMFIRQSRISLS